MREVKNTKNHTNTHTHTNKIFRNFNRTEGKGGALENCTTQHCFAKWRRKRRLHYASQPLWPPRCTLAAACATHFHPSQLECSVTWHRTSKQRERLEDPGKSHTGSFPVGTSVKVKTIPQLLEQPDQRHPPHGRDVWSKHCWQRSDFFFF